MIDRMVFSTILSCQTTSDYPLDVDPELFSTELSVASDDLHTYSTKPPLKMEAS